MFREPDTSPEPEVLLIFRNGRWDLPKGKLEVGEAIEMCAGREVSEEVGSSLPAIVSKIGTTYHEYSENEDVIGKTTYWYSMIFTGEENLIPQREEGIERVDWVPLSEAVDKVGYDNLRVVLRKFMEQKKV